MVPVNVELVNHLWLPNIFIYNLKTFKVAIFSIFYNIFNLKTQGDMYKICQIV